MAGAFGGMGGQSAFGTKAGDMFTKITVVVAAVWIILCVISVSALDSTGKNLKNIGKQAPDAAADSEGTAPTDDATSGGDAPSDE